MTRTLEIKTTNVEPLTLPLTADSGEVLSMTKLQTTVAVMLPEDKKFSLQYTDSDGDQVTIKTDADVKELEKYMQGEQLQRLEVLVVPQEPLTTQRAASVVQTQLRGLVTAMSKLTAKPETKPTPASALNLLVASLQAMVVADDAEELATIKKEMLLMLQSEEFREVVEELSTSQEFSDLAGAMAAAIYEEDAQAIEDAAAARFDELLVFAQRVVERCLVFKPVLVNVAKSLMTGLVRYNDEDVDGNSSSCSSSSSCYSNDQDTVDVLTNEVPLHLGAVCRGCLKTPLAGVRYKSLEVSNFDLCEECEASGNYICYEPFIKITDPSRAPKQKRTSELEHSYVTCNGCGTSPIVGTRFKSETTEDFDLCEACEASEGWESHGPFMKIEEPEIMRAMKFTCRRGGKFGRRGKFGRHHGGRRHGFHGHHGKFEHHHGPPGFAFHGPHPGQHGRPGFHSHGPPPHHHGDHEGHSDSQGRYGHGPPSEFDGRRRHHGPPGMGHHGYFGRFGAPPFEFSDPRGQHMCPRDFEHHRPRDFERWGHHGFRGRPGRHTRFSDGIEDDEQEQDRSHRGRHGCHERGRGRWGRDAAYGVGFAKGDVPDDNMEIVDAAESGDKIKGVENEDKLRSQNAMTQLVAMGFDDTEKNLRALELTDGNVGVAVNALLSE